MNKSFIFLLIFISHLVFASPASDQGYKLYLAAEKGDILKVKKMLKAKVDPNETGYSIGALPIASSRGHIEIVKLLLEANANVNLGERKNDGDHTAIHFATREGHTEIVKLLIGAKANLDIRGLWGRTALMTAIQNNRMDIAKLLLEAKADPNITDDYGETPLILASQKGSIELIKLLLQTNADPNLTKNKEGDSALLIASKSGNLEIIKLLLQAGADVNIKNSDHTTALMFACKNNKNPIYIEIVKTLIEAKADVNMVQKDGTTALLLATRYSPFDIVKQLLDADAEVNAKNNNGFTALMEASYLGRLDVIIKLLDKNADINAKHVNGTSSICYAVKNGDPNLEITKLLLKSGANVNESCEYGIPPLFWAAMAVENFETCRFLIKSGANVNSIVQNHSTVLMIAAQRMDTKLVELLLDSKADIHIKNSEGKTAFQIAASKKHNEPILELLTKAGADTNSISLPKKSDDVNVFESSTKSYDPSENYFIPLEILETISLGINEQELYRIIGSENVLKRYTYSSPLAKKLTKNQYIPVTKSISYSGAKTKITHTDHSTSYEPLERLGVTFFFYEDRLIHLTVVHSIKNGKVWSNGPKTSEEVSIAEKNKSETVSFFGTNLGGDQKFYAWQKGYIIEKKNESGERYFIPSTDFKYPLESVVKDLCKSSAYWELPEYEKELQNSKYSDLKSKLDTNFKNKTGYWKSN